MIKEISARPKPQNNNSKILMSVFFALAAVAIFISLAIESYKGVVSFVGILFLVSGVLVYTKYVAVQFYYDVMITDSGEPLFIVRQLSGRREITLCRVPIAEITSVKKESAGERKAYVRRVGVSLFVYFPTLSPAISYRISVGLGSETSEVLIECTDEFASLLLEYAKEARENLPLDEDEPLEYEDNASEEEEAD